VGLRERKKEKTRAAILDAALDLFLEQGYESTTVEQIAGAVDISPRTFFRYFTSKDHLVLWFHDHSEAIMLDALARRPHDEPPFASLMSGLRAVLAHLEESAPEEMERFLKLRRLFERHPHLVGLSVARGAETERRLAAEIAARRGSDPDEDRFAHLVVAFAMSAMRVGMECPGDATTMAQLKERLTQTLEMAERCLRPGWDRQS